MSSPKRFRFTNQLIKSLPPNTSDSRSTDAEYSDTEISGLKCLVSKGEGRKKFLLRYLPYRSGQQQTLYAPLLCRLATSYDAACCAQSGLILTFSVFR